MDLAKTLIRSVSRAFYDTRQILAVDALLVHSALRDDDLAHLLGMQTKELRKLCAKLEEHRLLAVHNRQEIREGMQRPISKTYYYIDFRQTIDAIKYRIYRVTKAVEGTIRPTEEKKDYFCPYCRSRWTQMEVLDNPGPHGFNCNKCGHALERDDESQGDLGGHEKQSKLMKQLEPLLSLLPQIDQVVIPDNTFEVAFSAAVPVQRNNLTNPVTVTVPISDTKTGPATVKGTIQAAPRIEVDLTSSEEKTAAEQAAEVERKARVAEQNALPVWHTNSTVSGEATALGSKEEAARREREAVLGGVKREGGGESEEKKPVTTAEAEMTDEVAQYYAQLARDRAVAKKEEDESGEEEDEDDDEGEFEDVPAPSPVKPTTAAAAATTTNGGSAPMARVASTASFESESSVRTGSATAVSTPAAAGINTAANPPTSASRANVNAADDNNEDGAAAKKRPRISPSRSNDRTKTDAKPSKPAQAVASAESEAGEEQDEDEDVEFEDV